MEQVVCINNGVIPDGLHMAGSQSFVSLMETIRERRFFALRDKTDTSISALENNTNIRQLIVYLLIQDGEELYIYQRSKGTGEKKLVGGYACPGGHMNSFTEDFHADIVLDSLRELEEELVLTTKPDQTVFSNPLDGVSLPMKVCALLQNSCDVDNGVHLVHTGIVVKINITGRFLVSLKETGKMENLVKVDRASYKNYLEKAEVWLQMLLPWTSQLLTM